jgi:hypothetical protein
MTVTYCGEVDLATALPGAAIAANNGILGINGALPDILSRIAALQSFSPSPVNFAVQLQLANGIVASIENAIALGLPAPSISAQIAAVLALIASLLATVSTVNAALGTVVAFEGLLASAGVHVFAFAGTTSALGTELDASVSGTTLAGASSAIILATDVSGTWSAMGQIFKVTP